MRIAIGAILQETNSFSPITGNLDHFRGVYYAKGAEIPVCLRDSSAEVSGFYDALENSGHQIIPTIAAMAVSGGRLERIVYETLRDELLNRLMAEGPPEAILLALHGAMSIEDEDDGDGRLLAELRSVVGMSCPVFVTHDLHANLTRQRVRLCDALVGYHTAPHVDHRSTGARAARRSNLNWERGRFLGPYSSLEFLVTITCCRDQ